MADQGYSTPVVKIADIPINGLGEPYCRACRAWHKGEHLPEVERAIRTAASHIVIIGLEWHHGSTVTLPTIPNDHFGH